MERLILHQNIHIFQSVPHPNIFPRKCDHLEWGTVGDSAFPSLSDRNFLNNIINF